MAELSISMPPALQQWVDHRIAEGRYADASDYVRDLVRRDQDERPDEVEEIRALIEEGLASGVLDAEPEDVLREIIAGLSPARD